MKKLLITCCIFLVVSCHKNKRINTNKFSHWKDVSTWSFTGKMAINNSKDSGSGKVNWSVSGDSTKAKFKAPLGRGSWEITEQSNQATLISSINGESFAHNADTLLANELGWAFPWHNLHYWLRGYQIDDSLIAHENLPPYLNANGWNVTFQQWVATPIGMLPKKIKASKPPYSIKLIIYNWKIK